MSRPEWPAPGPFIEGSVPSRHVRAALLSRLRAGAIPWLDRIAASALFAYSSIFLIQLKVIWGMWDFRDLPSGDTAAYFIGASQWAHSFSFPGFAWSPLYQVYYGSLQWLIPNTYDVTIVHRIVLVLAASLMVLLVLRRLLTPGIAWALALWWTLTPTNFDVLYEVYLFAVIPSLAAVWIASSRSGPMWRAAVFVLLFATALLARNELIVAAAAWGGIWIAYEVWQRRRAEVRPSLKKLAAAFAIPAVLVGGFVSFALINAKSGEGVNRSRQGLTMCQVYAATYRERHDVTRTEPFRGCELLMLQKFGRPYPTYAEAITSNPGAMAQFFGWNLSLLPYGLQLGLFNSTSGPADMDPDYVLVNHSSVQVGVLSVLLVAFVAVGLALLWRNRRWWWDTWLRKRAWGWLALICLALAVLVAVMITRPRPAYMFNLTVLLLAVIGMCAMVFANRWPRLGKLRAGLPVAAVALLIAVPSYYNANYETPQNGRDRPLMQMVNRLEPFRDQLEGQGRVQLLALRFPGEICSYVGKTNPCQGYSLQSELNKDPGTASIRDVIRARQINAIYADETILSNPLTLRLMDKLEGEGWRRLAPAPSSREPWMLLRSPSVTIPGTSPGGGALP